LPESTLAFTWCQVPIVYHLLSVGRPALKITFEDGSVQTLPEPSLPADLSAQLFRRTGRIRQISLELTRESLLR
jgi:hypothetical protein